MVKTAQSTWTYGPNMSGHVMKKERVCCSCGMQFSPSMKFLQAGETLKTVPLVDAVSAWRRLNSDVVAVISPCYSWLCKQEASLALPYTSSQGYPNSFSWIPLQQQHYCGELARAPQLLSSTGTHWETTSILQCWESWSVLTKII